MINARSSTCLNTAYEVSVFLHASSGNVPDNDCAIKHNLIFDNYNYIT